MTYPYLTEDEKRRARNLCNPNPHGNDNRLSLIQSIKDRTNIPILEAKVRMELYIEGFTDAVRLIKRGKL